MPPAISSPADTSTPPASSTPASPAASSPAPIDSSALRAADTGVKKSVQRKKSRNDGLRHTQKARLALRKMHAFFKAHRDDDECKGMTFAEQQRVLGKLWRASPENPKNGAV